MAKKNVVAAAAETPEVGTVETGTETPEQRVARLAEELKAARAVAKKTKTPAVQCSHKDDKGVQCRLFVMEGRDVCSNHRAAWERLTKEQQEAIEHLMKTTASELATKAGYALALALSKVQ